MTFRKGKDMSKENALWNLKEVISYLGCLHSEEHITDATYQYLYDCSMKVFGIVRDELPEDEEYPKEIS